jgi:hypothetical protein
MWTLLLALALSCGGEDPPLPPPGPHSLESPDPDERVKALWAIPEAERAELVPRLLTLIQEDPDSRVKQLALGIVGMTGDLSSIPVLLGALYDWGDTGAQLAAATALGNLDHPRACDALLATLVAWPQPATDMVANEIRDAIARHERSCRSGVRARLKDHPQEMNEILKMMERKR